MMEFVTWDDDIPNMMGSHKIHVPDHQPGYIVYIYYNISTRIYYIYYNISTRIYYIYYNISTRIYYIYIIIYQPGYYIYIYYNISTRIYIYIYYNNIIYHYIPRMAGHKFPTVSPSHRHLTAAMMQWKNCGSSPQRGPICTGPYLQGSRWCGDS